MAEPPPLPGKTGGGASAPPPPRPAHPAPSVSGPGTTSGAGRVIDDAKGRTYPCEQCGADVEFDIGSQRMKCPYCAHIRELGPPPAKKTVSEQDYIARIHQVAKKRTSKTAAKTDGVNEIRCDACGANVQFQGTLTATECAFCGAPVTREQIHDAEDRVPVDGVLPFSVEQSRAKQVLRDWVRSRWFAPREFKERGIEGRFAGVYVPYWTFDSVTWNDYTGQRGVAYYVTVGSGKHRRTERRVNWYPASGRFRRVFDDVMVVAETQLPVELLQKLEPWPLRDCKPWDPQMLSGFFAQTYDLPLERGFAQAKSRMESEIEAQTRIEIGGDEQRIHSIDSVFDPITYKHLLLPVWLLSYKYRDKTYRVVVNATTGEVQGTRPWSVWKITFLVLAILAVIGGIAAIAAAS